MIIHGRKIAEKVNKLTAQKVKKLAKRGIQPKIAVFLVGKHEESEIYVRQKEKLAKQLGFRFMLVRQPSTISQKKLIEIINRVQNSPSVSGVIVQLPLPARLDSYKVLSALNTETDIDCLSDKSLGRLFLNNHIIEPPTAGAVMEIIKNQKLDLPGKKIIVIGSGLLVGKPLVMMLMNAGATVTACNKATKQLPKICREADILISGAGQKKLIKAGMVKEGSLVIDAGFSYSNGKVSGDADVGALDRKGAKVTPTPGGVGPITVSRLMYNAAICAEHKMKS